MVLYHTAEGIQENTAVLKIRKFYLNIVKFLSKQKITFKYCSTVVSCLKVLTKFIVLLEKNPSVP